MLLFFQRASLWQTLLTAAVVRKADRILFYHPNPLGEDPAPAPSLRRRLVRTVIRLLNPSAPIEDVDREGLYRLGYYQNNFESDRHVETVFKQVESSAAYEIVRDLLDHDPCVALFYKMRLLDGVRERTAFLRAASTLLGPQFDGAVVPAEPDRYGLDRQCIPAEDCAGVVPISIRLGHRLVEIGGTVLRAVSFWNPLLLGLVPLAFLAGLVLRRGVAWRTDLIRADVVMPLVWGFAKEGLLNGWKRSDNGYLVGEGLGYDRFAFYFDDWLPDAEQAAQRRTMDRQGICWFDPKTFVPSLGYLRQAGAFCLRLWAGLLRRPRILLDDPWVVRISAAFLYHYLRELLFAESVDFKVALEYQDYLSHHVLRTMLANRKGRLTVGVHHSAPDGPYGFPVLRYAHTNRYCVWGEEIHRLYAPHWDRLDTRYIGAPGVDAVVMARQGECRYELERFYREQYGGRRPLMVVFFPSLSSLNVRGRVSALIRGLGRLKDLPFEFQVVCRFRAVEHIETFLAQGLRAVVTADSRIAVDMTDLSTHEWIALSDVVVVNSISTVMVEAAAGKPCFAFDNTMLAELVFARFGSDLVLKTAEDLVRVLRHVGDGFRGWDCRWDELGKRYSYYADGRNMDRFRRVIIEAIAEVEAGQRTGLFGHGQPAGESAWRDNVEVARA